MSVVTIGLDFGTSSIKCVARRFDERNERVEPIRSPHGSLRWPSLLGRAEDGKNASLLLFEECRDAGGSRILKEPNLKLAFFLEDDDVAANGLRRRWQARYHMAPTLVLLAAAIRHALDVARKRWPAATIHICVGAPVAPHRDTALFVRFERGLHTALCLAQAWESSIPEAAKAVRAADAMWQEITQVPPESERTTFVIPEAVAACEGVATVGSVALRGERLCVVDVGGGTTDIAWAWCGIEGGYDRLSCESVPIASEILDADLARAASRPAGRHVPRREEIWLAKQHPQAVNGALAGEDWSLTSGETACALNGHLGEIRQRILNVHRSTVASDGRGNATAVTFVGGGTAWAYLRDRLESLLSPEIGGRRLSVEEFGVGFATKGTPLAVALGLSSGLQLKGWSLPDGLLEEDRIDPVSPSATFIECACRGLLELCCRCGGSGKIVTDEPRSYTASLDPFQPPPDAVRCVTCDMYVNAADMVAHLRREHGFSLGSAGRANFEPPRRRDPLVRIDQVKRHVSAQDREGLQQAEELVAAQLEHFWSWCCIGGACAEQSARKFLNQTRTWTDAVPWLHLARAMAFAVLRDDESCRYELDGARTAKIAETDSIERMLSGRPIDILVTWECLLL